MGDYINRFFGLFFKMFRKNYPRDTRSTAHDNHPTAHDNHPQSRYATPLGSATHLNYIVFEQPYIKRYCSLPSVQDQVSSVHRCPSQISILQAGTPTRQRIRRRNSISVGDNSRPYVRQLPPLTPDTHIVLNLPAADREFKNPNNAQNSCHSFETCSVADGWFDDMRMPPDYERQGRPKRLYQPRIQRFPHIGYHFKNQTNTTSRIPLRRLCRTKLQACPNKEFNKVLHLQNRKNVKHNESTEIPPEREEIGDGPRVGGTHVSNWIAYRHDTNMKFEQAFKILSKKKRSIGNLIDSTTHAQWMQACGIYIDKDASLFKIFSGGKVVLTCGEYKFFLDQICSTNEMDYWDVLRKMATFPDNEINEVLF